VGVDSLKVRQLHEKFPLGSYIRVRASPDQEIELARVVSHCKSQELAGWAEVVYYSNVDGSTQDKDMIDLEKAEKAEPPKPAPLPPKVTRRSQAGDVGASATDSAIAEPPRLDLGELVDRFPWLRDHPAKDVLQRGKHVVVLQTASAGGHHVFLAVVSAVSSKDRFVDVEYALGDPPFGPQSSNIPTADVRCVPDDLCEDLFDPSSSQFVPPVPGVGSVVAVPSSGPPDANALQVVQVSDDDADLTGGADLTDGSEGHYARGYQKDDFVWASYGNVKRPEDMGRWFKAKIVSVLNRGGSHEETKYKISWLDGDSASTQKVSSQLHPYRGAAWSDPQEDAPYAKVTYYSSSHGEFFKKKVRDFVNARQQRLDDTPKSPTDEARMWRKYLSGKKIFDKIKEEFVDKTGARAMLAYDGPQKAIAIKNIHKVYTAKLEELGIQRDREVAEAKEEKAKAKAKAKEAKAKAKAAKAREKEQRVSPSDGGGGAAQRKEAGSKEPKAKAQAKAREKDKGSGPSSGVGSGSDSGGA